MPYDVGTKLLPVKMIKEGKDGSHRNHHHNSRHRFVAATTTNTSSATTNNSINNNISHDNVALQELPTHTVLANGRHVTLSVMADTQISDMFRMISQAARHGEGFAVDEFPNEAEFRSDIRGGHSFVVSCKDSGKMIGAFSLATSKFYRGTDLKVADPIIIVKHTERAKGVGDFMFKQVVHLCRKLGYSAIYVDTFSNNVAMRKIVEGTSGFCKVGTLPMGGTMPDGSIVGTNVYYKNLSNAGGTDAVG